jgi:hypothetical protein
MGKSMRYNRVTTVLLWLVLMQLLSGTANADKAIDITVKTVLASQEAKFHDPRLSELIRQLQSVFRYTSYRLLSHNRMSLRPGETGTARLPGERVLRITPRGIRQNRAELQLEIFKRRRSIFNTTIRLRNRSSITVGGPQHQQGYLLFNISNSF